MALKGHAADAADATATMRLIVQIYDEDEDYFLSFPCNGTPVE
jgi:hypothetical protein